MLWYDVNWPLTAEGWESEKMNRMVRQFQPDTPINNCAGIPEDFTTPEQYIQAYDYPWESCMTMNDSWGFNSGDDNWKSPRTIVRDHGNYLLNIGPKAGGSIPEPSIQVLTAVGKWMATHADLVHKADHCQVKSWEMCAFTRQNNMLYVHTYFWPGETVAFGGLKNKALSAKMYPGGQTVKFEQTECDGEPVQDMRATRVNRKRESV
jgi:alpha-L-fucosidase